MLEAVHSHTLPDQIFGQLIREIFSGRCDIRIVRTAHDRWPAGDRIHPEARVWVCETWL